MINDTFHKEMEELIRSRNRIGVVASGSSNTSFNVQFLEDPTKEQLVGEMVVMSFKQGASYRYAFCQITRVVMENPWHEDSGIRTLIRRRGRVETISEVQDVHVGILDVNSVFYLSENGQVEAANMGTVPPTGTELYRASEDVISRLFAEEKEKIFYLGTRYGSSGNLPFVLRHFDHDEDGQGAGEAYHIGVFGKTGSGKSVLAKMLLFAYARHKNMTVFVIDPQGEFSGDLRRTDNEFNMKSSLEDIHGSRVHNPTITDLALDEIDMFAKILKEETPFFDRVQIRHEQNQEAAWDVIQDTLAQAGIDVKDFHKSETFKSVVKAFSTPENQKYIYRTAGSLEGLSNKVKALSSDNEKGWKELYQKYWVKVANLFSSADRKMPISEMLDTLFPEAHAKRSSRSPIIVIDLSEKNVDTNKILWNSKIKNIVIERLIRGLQEKGQKFYREDRNCNALVIIDEAHRLVPSYIGESDSGREEASNLKYSLVDAIRTTRKYGIGWMFISQTLGSLDSEIIRQLRIMFFGFGLGAGNEGAALASQIGVDASSISLYRSFVDPHAALSPKNRSYPFMAVGPASPLAASGSPLFFSALDYPRRFFAENNIQQSTRPQAHAAPSKT